MQTAATSQSETSEGFSRSKGRPTFARLHVAVGITTLVLFLITGVYMRTHSIFLLPDGVRLLYRSRHIYLLFSGLLNLLIGVQYREAVGGEIVRRIGSSLVLAAPAFLFAAFFLDSQRGDLNTPLSHLGIYAFAAGSILLAWANRKAL